MKFTRKQIDRYSRQIILKKVGVIGQKKLLKSRVLIVGAGGLGSPISIYLAALGIEHNDGLLPNQLFAFENLSLKNLLLLVLGGFLVGFGVRYAGGCTSGHAISGLSNLQLPSLVAVIGFFIGGLLMTHVLFPLIF